MKKLLTLIILLSILSCKEKIIVTYSEKIKIDTVEVEKDYFKETFEAIYPAVWSRQVASTSPSKPNLKLIDILQIKNENQLYIMRFSISSGFSPPDNYEYQIIGKNIIRATNGFRTVIAMKDTVKNTFIFGEQEYNYAGENLNDYVKYLTR